MPWRMQWRKRYDPGRRPQTFYLQLHAYAVHGPVQARPRLERVRAKKLGKENSKKANLAGFISGMDAVLGRLLLSLEDPNGDGDKSDGIAKETLILFTSDNGGTHFDNLPLRGSKVCSPKAELSSSVAYGGTIPSNTVTDGMVHGIDFYPTLVELAGNRWLPSAKKHPLDRESSPGSCKPDSKAKRSPLFYLFPGYMDARAQPCVVRMTRSKANDTNYSIFTRRTHGSFII